MGEKYVLPAHVMACSKIDPLSKKSKPKHITNNKLYEL